MLFHTPRSPGRPPRDDVAHVSWLRALGPGAPGWRTELGWGRARLGSRAPHRR